MILVAGPPCSGKSTYVREHAAPGATVVEFERFVEVLSATNDRYDVDPAVRASAAQRWRDEMDGDPAWVIWAAPRRQQRGMIRERYGADVVVMMASEQTCLERARAERPPEWQGYVRSWFAEFQPSRSGREMIVRTDR